MTQPPPRRAPKPVRADAPARADGPRAFLSRRNERYALFAADLVLVAASFVGALVLRYDLAALGRLGSLVLVCAPALMAICALVFAAFGLYSRQWRSASLADALAIAGATVASLALFALVARIDGRLAFVPPGVLVATAILLAGSVGALRLALRVSGVRGAVGQALVRTGLVRGDASGEPPDEPLPILVIGAGEAGTLYLRALAADAGERGRASHRCVGVLDDEEPAGSRLRGVPVLGGLADFDAALDELAPANRPRHVVFSRPVASFGREAAERLIDAADRRGIPASCLAAPTTLHDPRVADRLALRPIELTDLLGRPQTALDRTAVSRLLRDRVVMVTGAGGSIGSELVRQAATFGPARLVLIDNCEFNLYAVDRDLAEMPGRTAAVPYLCDIRHGERLDEIFRRERPDLVFNAAALKHVPMVEVNPCEGVLTNVAGTAKVAEAARRHGALAMVQVSTDKAVDSTSVMGATKRLGELYCQALDLEHSDEPGRDGAERATRFMTTRFGNVLGSSGSLIPLFQRQLERGGPLTVTDPAMTRFFMTIREAVELTLHACAAGLAEGLGRGEVFVLDMGAPLRIIDVARRMIRLAGLEPDRDIAIEIVGRRPGEKLFEELFDSHESRVESPIAGVLGAVPRPVPIELLREAVADLERDAHRGDLDAVFETMCRIMPRYRPAERHNWRPRAERLEAAE